MRRLGYLLIAVALVATGCAGRKTNGTSGAPAVDLTGEWRGKWTGYGPLHNPREGEVVAALTQQGALGTGRFVMQDTNAAEPVPETVRRAGLKGMRVEFEVSGNEVVMRHELDHRFFTADLKVEDDRMLGQVRDSRPPVDIVLTRVKPPAPVAAAPPPPPPPPPPPAPEPPKPQEPVAAAPPTPPVEPARPEPKEFAAVPEVKPIYFDFDKSDLRPDDVKILDANADWLKTNAETLVLIQGFCDDRGTPEYNLALGERRALAARDYLISRGIAADRISVISYGLERPVCTERDEACWSKNRRDEFLIKAR